MKNGEVKIGEYMYAIVENGGKQYKAVEGSYIELDLLPDQVGKKRTFDKVLLLSTEEKVEVGTPYLKGVSVNATVTSHFKGPKVTVFKYRPKQRYRIKTGHRQRYSRVMIDSIAFPGKSKAADTKKKSDQKKTSVSKKKKTTTKKKSTATKSTTKKPTAAKSTTKKPTAAKTQKAAEKKS